MNIKITDENPEHQVMRDEISTAFGKRSASNKELAAWKIARGAILTNSRDIDDWREDMWRICEALTGDAEL